MESEKHLQSVRDGDTFEGPANETSECLDITTVTDQLPALGRNLETLHALRPHLDPEFATRKGAGRALTKACKSLLTVDERCQGLSDILDVSEQLDQHLALFDEGRKMERKARRLECLRAARLAPRCEQVKPDGMRCGSPAMGGQKLCFFHNLARNNAIEFPVVEDRRGLQVAILRVCERLANGTMPPANAKILLEGLSMAAENARNIAREDTEA